MFTTLYYLAFQSFDVNTFKLNPKWGRDSIFIEPPPPHKSKFQSWYLTPYCVLEVQNPTKAPKSVKDPAGQYL
jgi:hypothetical protein